MQFTKNNSNRGKGSFFLSLALCILAIAAVGAVTFSRYNAFKSQSEKQNNDSDNSSIIIESQPKKDDNNVTSTPKAPENTESTAQSVSDVPYESTPEEKPENKFVLPVTGEITKSFSDSVLQYSETFGDMRLHTGIDIKCAEGTPVLSCGAGTVFEVGEDASNGRYIIIEHIDGIKVKYCGLKEISAKSGETVKAGDEIGKSGTVPSESADKPHLHFEVSIDDKPVSPTEALNLE